MTVHELINTHGAVVNHDGIEQFKTLFRGEVIRPGDGDYETVRIKVDFTKVFRS